MTRLHSTYHADCLCGRPITSETRVTKCENCHRVLVFEWGGKPVAEVHGEFTVEDETPKSKGASA